MLNKERPLVPGKIKKASQRTGEKPYDPSTKEDPILKKPRNPLVLTNKIKGRLNQVCGLLKKYYPEEAELFERITVAGFERVRARGKELKDQMAEAEIRILVEEEFKRRQAHLQAIEHAPRSMLT